MKLELKTEKDIQILVVTGPLTEHDIKVLRAGITKLFKSGKNKIILELTDASGLPAEVLRELSVLNLLAREMSGEIVLSNVDAATQQKIKTFAKPPPVLSFPDRASAIESFSPQQEPEAEGSKALEDKKKEIQALKEQLRNKETSELAKLRKDNAELGAKIKTLEQQLLAMVIERRAPPDAQSYDEKIRSLETQVESLMTKLSEAKPA
jgi:hypothetical protein